MSLYRYGVRIQKLLAASAILLASSSLAGVAHAAGDAPRVVTDLGAMQSDAQLALRIWLAPRDPDRFDKAVRDRMTAGSATYHQWMTPADIAAYAPSGADLAALTHELAATGLHVTSVAADGLSLRVAGNVSQVQRAFGIAIHRYAIGSDTVFANTQAPRFTGAHAAMIDSIGGLTNARMAPFVRRQVDFATGAPTAWPNVADVGDPSEYFTDDCFVATTDIDIARFRPGGRTVHDVLSGPGYVASRKPGLLCGYTAAQVSTHYGLNAAYAKGYTGEGTTIVIVDAYGSPSIQSDANIFSQKMGLPALESSNFKVVYPDGPAAGDPYQTSWPVETSLDVEWAHAIAPKAKIVLAIAPDDNVDSLNAVLRYAVIHNLGDVVSNSYGLPEAVATPDIAHAFDRTIEIAAAQGIAVNVSSGDSGDNGLGTPVGAASIPADSPYATAIGGTSLGVPSDDGPVETAWGTTVTAIGNQNALANPPEILGFQSGGGGGESVFFGKPWWQIDLPGHGRELPDISAIADPQTGAIIVVSGGDPLTPIIGTIGGTSLSSPVMSGVWALAEQASHKRLGQMAPIVALTRFLGAVHDIVPIAATRSNLAGTVTQFGITTSYSASDLLGLTATQPTGFVGTYGVLGLANLYDVGFGADSSLRAAKGWDNATGYGVPNGLTFIETAKLLSWLPAKL